MAAKVSIVGSVALDTIEGPGGSVRDILGGSCSYAAYAASFYAEAGVIAAVGEDFPAAARSVLMERPIDLRGFATVPGRTFRWSGRYAAAFASRETLALDLGVFGSFRPDIREPLPAGDILFLANIDPDLQLDTVAKAGGRAFVATDTIDHWIRNKRGALLAALGKTNLFFVNDEEVRLLTGEANLVTAGQRARTFGPEYVVVKKGEHGSILFSGAGMALMPAFPLESVTDPTGAGDSFAGAMLGFLAREGLGNRAVMSRAMAYASAMASFTVEAFSLERLRKLSIDEIEARVGLLRNLVRF